MAVLTGADGQLKYNGKICAKARDWTIAINKDALEDTHLGLYDRTYIEGLRGATGSLTLLYDPGNSDDRALLNSIFNNSNTKQVEFVFNRNSSGTVQSFTVGGFLTSVSQSVSVGTVQACSCNFQISGDWQSGDQNQGTF